MTCFPQLGSGAVGQFPLVKRRVARTILDALPDGSSVRLNDSGAAAVEWEMELRELTDAERESLIDFFADVEGPLTGFRFLDPVGNLLAWSEDLGGACWLKAPQLSLAGGQADPWGTVRATRVTNAGPGAGKIRQVVEAPAALVYCLSVWARSAGPGTVRLWAGSGSGERKTGAQWERLAFGWREGGTAESVEFGIEVEAGGCVDLFGWQVEAQPGASGYKKTLARGGVYEDAHFAAETLEVVSEGPENHRARVRIRARAA